MGGAKLGPVAAGPVPKQQPLPANVDGFEGMAMSCRCGRIKALSALTVPQGSPRLGVQAPQKEAHRTRKWISKRKGSEDSGSMSCS